MRNDRVFEGLEEDHQGLSSTVDADLRVAAHWMSSVKPVSDHQDLMLEAVTGEHLLLVQTQGVHQVAEEPELLRHGIPLLVHCPLRPD